jgi:branched-subunit amino acid aminotransferase/4-amino-4-deoxychorismate lyase
MDTAAAYTFYSRMGGFIPTEVAVDTVFTNPLHYGAGGFEGIRLVRTPFGDGFIDLPHNIARFIYSSLAFDPTLQLKALGILENEKVSHIMHSQRIPQDFYADASAAFREGRDIELNLNVHYKDGRVQELKIPVKMRVKFGHETKEFTLAQIHAATCSLAFLNDLVRYNPYPNSIAQIDGGYFRPVFWVSGEEGLKVPTVIEKDGKLDSKPLYFAIGTLPWTQYLNAEHYEQGLNLLLAPLPRVNNAMPFKQKIAGVYVNSAMNINIAHVMNQGRDPQDKFGEILALNSEDRVVEGSAENIIIVFTHKNSGEMVAFCPSLASNILPGTTRGRMLEAMEDGIEFEGKVIKTEMEAPHKDMLIGSLKGNSSWEVSSIMLMGTGVGLIHARSLTVNEMVQRILRIDQLRSEDESPSPFQLDKLSDHEATYLINGGIKHSSVDAFQRAYERMVLSDNGSRVYLPSDINPSPLQSIMGVSLDEVEGGKEFRKKSEDGHFRQRINGLKQPDELTSRYKEAKRVIVGMTKASIQKRTAPKPQKSPITFNGC